jgi:Tfp pilus assembly protein PilF
MKRRSLRSLWLSLVFFVPVVLMGCASRNTPQTQLIRQASEYRQMMERQKASADEEALKKVPPLTAEGYEKLGDRYFLQGKADIAFKNYYEALRLEPGRIRARYKIGRLFLEKGLLEEAEKEFRGVLEKNPGYALAREGLGRVYLGRQKLGEAEKEFATAIQLEPSLWQAHNFLGIIYDRQREFKKAFFNYQKAISLQPNVGILYNNLGMSLFLKGEYEASLQAIIEGAKLDPNNKRILNNLGLLLCKMGRFQEAFETFKRSGNEASAYYNIGCFYLMEKKYKEAIQSYQKAIDTKPEFYVEAYEKMNQAKAALATSSL